MFKQTPNFVNIEGSIACSWPFVLHHINPSRSKWVPAVQLGAKCGEERGIHLISQCDGSGQLLSSKVPHMIMPSMEFNITFIKSFNHKKRYEVEGKRKKEEDKESKERRDCGTTKRR